MSNKHRQLNLNAFLYGTGHHEASWRLPETSPERSLDFEHVLRIVQTAERGLLDSVFLADGYSGRSNKLEPFTQLAALASRTKHIGLIATVGTTYNEPFHVARKFASLDHISKGRAGWNIVTGSGSAAENFSREEHPEHSLRYEEADEFVEVVKQLWDSWEDDAVLNDKASGTRIERSKVHKIDYKGSYYSVQGPLNIARPPQGYPVLVQAGSSESGREFAAKVAEVIFTAHQSIGSAQAFYSDVKSRLAKYGRTPDQLKILPGISPILADTVEEAKEIENQLFEFVNKEGAIKRLSERLGIDLSDYPLDKPLSLEGVRQTDDVNGNKSRHQLILDLIEDESLTLKQLVNRLAGARGHFTFTGTPLQLADVIETWFLNGAADGFNVMPQIYPSGLEVFVDKVIPELQNRGMFRTAYEGHTLRDNLGLARPANERHRAHAVNESIG
ncbi:FMN-dependent oxidoreductase (nitrilotriacetate monooxygenase family) [Paenibacillus cellulosilyticus]|uniref:FMN-dependent oxidoreductase (Nitrilotriacetate monooxygenase family) n=1 Tax=Paenibacillus cellulosilyticus TaxID=375489 RepID=A0A2V2Z0X6_9BACL|nr:LLM class flavin-dependent oxidoreductase [Paenibacillus cellulosilyticus]PWW06239.1 FMN-dependent oxidoreductase (nitrilotriacetate monooxygenase family) [Paenibacillus cellulosilyticus]QKS43003.1 LLM class flavin-dependent oxidoreductase [Paenibacillus cellulosilyticus]